MIRKIINIDRDKCNGCKLCVDACHEGAIGMVDGKAELLRDDYCDGLGDCLPVCPTDAITFIDREALEYNEEEVKNNLKMKSASIDSSSSLGSTSSNNSSSSLGSTSSNNSSSSLGSTSSIDSGSSLDQNHPCVNVSLNNQMAENRAQNPNDSEQSQLSKPPQLSELMQWPVQIKLVPVNVPYFNNAKLLIAADCSAFAYARFHQDFIKGRITLIGCPKLDDVDYSEKLTQILSNNDIKDVKIVRMEVPCCGGIENATKNALKDCGKMIPWGVVTISTDGKIIE